jgi:putative ABC transport system permease protein
MLHYNFELALQGLRRFPKSTLLVMVTVALGLSASMTTLTLLHMLSADPLPGRSQHLYLAWVDTVQSKPNSGTIYLGKNIKMTDAQALLASRRAVRQAAMADVNASVAAGDGMHMQKNQTLLATTGDFISMFGVPLRHGRSWSAAEDAARAPVTVIDSDLAKKLFGTTDAVGRSLLINAKVFQVIGVSAPYAPQPHFYGLDSWAFSADSRENLYAPYTAALDAGLTTQNIGECDATAVRKTLFALDPTHCAWLGYWVWLDTPKQVIDYRDYLNRYAQQQKTLAGFTKPARSELFSVSEWLAQQNVIPDNVRLNVWMAVSFLLLCMVNVAGLLTARFLRRSGEIGIRRALGAPRRAVFQQHILESGIVCVMGGVLALPLTLLGLWILRQQDQGFTDLARLDTSMFGALFLLALLVGVLVGVVPAWRASAVEPGLQVKSA